MLRIDIHLMLPLLWALCASAASAQSTMPPPRSPADPGNAQAAVPAVAYRSALSGYRRLGADTLLPWREANDEVARIGGWRAYLREASQAQSAPQPAAQAAQQPTALPAGPPSPAGQAVTPAAAASAPPAAATPMHSGHKTH